MMDVNDSKKKIFLHNRSNPYVDITPYELDVGFPIVNYPSFFPQSDEVILYAVPAATFKDKEQVVGYTGKSAGASVRVAKGVTIRTGSSGGSPIRSTVRKHNTGDLIITNKRVIFIGKDDSSDFAVNKISAVKPLSSDSFIIQAGRSSKNILVDPAAVIYAAGFVNYAVGSFNDGIDIKSEKEKADNKITPEQRALCDSIRQEIQIMSSPNSIKETGKKKIGCFTRILWGLLIFFAVILVFVVIYVISSSSPNHGVDSQGNIIETQSYTDTEILYKEGHPLIYDSYDSAKDFYADVDRNKVKVISIADHAAIERKLESLTSDEVILYLIQDSTYKDYVGTVQINLFSPELTSDMSIDKAVDLLTDYLPDGFGEYYSQDSCYKYSQDAIDVYTWSGRLNDLGTEYHNNGHGELSYYYYLKFIHYGETNQWKLETGYAAYGDKDVGWIEKYAEPWEVDMSSYFAK